MDSGSGHCLIHINMLILANKMQYKELYLACQEKKSGEEYLE
jgi:hypothetical protein